MPFEFYLFIFLLASTLIFVFFYATRAKVRGRVRMTKVSRPSTDKTGGADVPTH